MLLSSLIPGSFFTYRKTLLSEKKHEVLNEYVISYIFTSFTRIHRGSYMSAHVLLNLLNELRKR